MGIKEIGEGKRATSGECSLTQTFSTWLATTKGNGGDDGRCCCLSVWRTVCAAPVLVSRFSEAQTGCYITPKSQSKPTVRPQANIGVFHVFVVVWKMSRSFQWIHRVMITGVRLMFFCDTSKCKLYWNLSFIYGFIIK